MFADLFWRKHYYLISSCACRTLGLLRCTFNTTNSVNLEKLLYLSLVCSQLTYFSIIWHPYLHKNILMLEMIQWRATKFILNDYSSDHKSRFTPTAPSDALWAQDIIFFVKSLNCITSTFNYVSVNMTPDHQLTTNWSCSMSPAQIKQITLTDFHVFGNPYQLSTSINHCLP